MVHGHRQQRRLSAIGTHEISRFPRKEHLHMPGSLTTPGRLNARDDAPRRVAFHDLHGVGTQNRKLSRLTHQRGLLAILQELHRVDAVRTRALNFRRAGMSGGPVVPQSSSGQWWIALRQHRGRDTIAHAFRLVAELLKHVRASAQPHSDLSALWGQIKARPKVPARPAQNVANRLHPRNRRR
jgi:hypothetical protein